MKQLVSSCNPAINTGSAARTAGLAHVLRRRMGSPLCQRLALVASLFVCLGGASRAAAEASPWQSDNRIAISADGNPGADPDDIGATPMTLAVLAKAGLQDNLVHYDFNNWLEYKKISANKNDMWVGAMGGQARWGFDRNRFFDASNDPDGAIANLTAQINQSSEGDPLYVILGGPVELLYRALAKADKGALTHVYLVSHSGYNDYYKARLWQRNLDNILVIDAKITYRKIPDQNQDLLRRKEYGPWHWLRDHADPNLQWVYQRMEAGKPDVSDTGMLTWLIGLDGGDERTSLEELQAYLGDEPIPTNGGSADKALPAPAGVEPVVTPPLAQSIFQEVGGKIVIEAERVPLTDSWVVEKTEPGYSGDGYIRYMPGDINAVHSQARGVLTYKLRITTPGTYRMALKHSHRGAPAHGKWADCWTLMGLDVNPWGSVRKTYHSISKEAFEGGAGFTFDTTHANYGTTVKRDGKTSIPAYELDAGDHYFFVVGRSGGYRLDKIHFFKEGVSGFKDDSVPATPVLPGG